jgi:hypothetical protein
MKEPPFMRQVDGLYRLKGPPRHCLARKVVGICFLAPAPQHRDLEKILSHDHLLAAGTRPSKVTKGCVLRPARYCMLAIFLLAFLCLLSIYLNFSCPMWDADVATSPRSNAELPEWLAREDDLPEQQEFSQYSEDGVTEYLIQNVLIGNILLGIWYRVGIRMQQ